MAESETPAPAPAAPQCPRSDRIGAELRRVFDASVAEPLPDTFEDLLDQLK